MVTPAPGDYQGVPMTPAAREVADAWDPAKEEASGDLCKSYGAPALLRVPERLHITWQDDQTLRMDTDAGKQTRTFHFGDWKPAAAAPPTLQGDSSAEWERGGGRGATDGSLKVTTSNLKAGFLRKNGVPYSEKTTLTEYYDLIKEPNGDPLMVVTIVTTDPMYLTPAVCDHVPSSRKRRAMPNGIPRHARPRGRARRSHMTLNKHYLSACRRYCA